MKEKIIGYVLLPGLLILALFATISCSDPEQKKQKHYNKALEYLNSDNANAAIVELKNAIKLDPKFSEARYKLGEIYLATAAPAKAFEEYIRAADLDPENIDANLKTAQFYMLAQNRAASRKYIDQIRKREPNNREALILLANIELLDGNSAKALEIVDSFGQDVAQSSRLLNLKSRIYATDKNWEQAESTLRKAIATAPENLLNYVMLLQFLEQQGDTGKVENLLTEMEASFPNDPQIYRSAAGYYRATRQFDKAESALRKVLDLSPESPLPSLQLIEYYEQRGRLQEALALAQQAADKFPDETNLKISIASLLFDQKKFDASRQLLDKILAADQRPPTAELLHARFLLKEEKYRDSLEIFRNLTQEYPDWATPYYYLAISHLALGESQQAETAIGKALERNKNETKYFTLMAQLQQTKGNFSNARNDATAALLLNPQNLQAATILGKAFIGLKEYRKATSVFTQIQKFLPEDINNLESLAIAALGSKEFDAGEKYLMEILALDPGNNRAVTLYLALKFPKDLQGATTFIKEQLEKTPKDARLHLVLANLLSRQGNTEEALLSLHTAQQGDPDKPESYLSLAHIYSTLGKKDEAMIQYRQLLERQPQSIPALMGIAALHQEKDEALKAMEYYETILQITPNYAPAANNLAWLTAEQKEGDLGRALQLAMIAKQKSPENPQIADTLGWVHLKRKSYSLAIEQFKLALEKSPGNPAVLYHLAFAYNASGEKELARQTLEKINMAEDFTEKREVERLQEELL